MDRLWRTPLRYLQDRIESRHETRRNRLRAAFLRRVLPTGGVGAELGVHKGYFTQHLIDVAAPTRLHLIDAWHLLGPEWNWGLGNRSTVHALAGIRKTYRDEIARGQVVIDVGLDLEVLRGFPDGYFDWVYLDTTHQYEQTLMELNLLASKVKPGGIIAGDDWRADPEHEHHGVCRAVQQFVGGSSAALVHADERDLQWAIRLQR